MIQIFRDAGYHVDGGYRDGVMRLVFPIDATDTSVGVMQAREHRAEAASIQLFFDARSVAVIGASRRHDTIGQTLVRNLVLGDYQGRVYVVNPAASSVAGLPAYASSGTSRTRSTWRSSRCPPSPCRTSSSTAPPRACTGCW